MYFGVKFYCDIILVSVLVFVASCVWLSLLDFTSISYISTRDVRRSNGKNFTWITAYKFRSFIIYHRNKSCLFEEVCVSCFQLMPTFTYFFNSATVGVSQYLIIRKLLSIVILYIYFQIHFQ